MALNRSVRTARPAFTLIELLVVIGIIGVLVGLTLVVGVQVVGGGKQRLTQDTLRVLDQALQEYIAVKGENPPAVFSVVSGGNTLYYPVADARAWSPPVAAVPGEYLQGRPMVNSVGYFFEEARKIGSVSKVLDSLPQNSVRVYDIDGAGPQPPLMTVFDGWGRPIRFVHPAFQGVITDAVTSPSPSPATERDTKDVWPLPGALTYVPGLEKIRRNNEVTSVGDPADQQPDADGGMCVGYRPYFYSLGADGLAGVKKDTSATPARVVENYNTDNVYSVTPNFTDK